MRAASRTSSSARKGVNIKETIGDTDGVFRFPSTFTFIYRAFTIVDGIGKGLSDDFEIGQLIGALFEFLVCELLVLIDNSDGVTET